MLESENGTQGTSGITGTPEQPVKNVRPSAYFIYKKTIDNLSQMLLSEDWDTLTSDSGILSTVKSGLRDTIKRLEELEKEKKEKVIDGVLEAVDMAYRELTKASVLLRKKDIKYIDHLAFCRKQLNLAFGLIPTDLNDS